MRILLINKFLRPVGGTETVFFNEWRWLEEAGHEVVPFGMAHPENVRSPYADYWPSQISYRRAGLRQALDLIWSREAARCLDSLIAETGPQVAHLHNIYHQLSPSILSVLAGAGIPAVMTVHDYKLICPNYRLYTEAKVCTRCVNSHAWHALRHRCQKDSIAASALVALETTLHRWRRVYDSIARFLTPSRFVRDLMIQGGLPAARIRVLPHAIDPAPPAQVGSGSLSEHSNEEHVLYAGRLEPEKGLSILLEVARRLPTIPFKIAGDGSLAGPLLEQSRSLANVKLLGKLDAARLARLRQTSILELIPSTWYEIFGMSALEAMQAGVPVIASNSGALPDVVKHEENGLLVAPGDADEWAAAVARLWRDRPLAAALGKAGRERVERQNRPKQHVQALEAVFQELAASPAQRSELAARP